jgi:hypothetical protein
VSSGVQLAGSQISWDLRGAWATGRRVALRLDETCEIERVEGTVSHVAASSAFVRIRDLEGEIIVPMGAILSLHWPHWLEGGSSPRDALIPQLQEAFPGQLGLVGVPAVGPRGIRAVTRAAASMMAPDVMGVLVALDRAGRRPTLASVAVTAGRSERWVSVRLRRLETEGYVRRVRRARKRDLWMFR